jgi:hypothetical protein
MKIKFGMFKLRIAPEANLSPFSEHADPREVVLLSQNASLGPWRIAIRFAILSETG